MCEAWGIHLFQITINEIPGFLPPELESVLKTQYNLAGN